MLAAASIIIMGKSAAALAITSLYRPSLRTGAMIAALLAQIGEFSFVLAGLGVSLGLLSTDTYNLLLANALNSIALDPLLFELADAYSGPRRKRRPEIFAPLS